MAARKKVKAAPRGRRDRAPAAAQSSQGAITHDDVMQASVRIDPDLRRRSELLWEDRSRPTRGPKPSLTPDEVVQAAIDIADEEGLAALTMQAVSARLGFTTMAVYRYFPSKEALYDAIVDAGMGLPPAPQEPRGDWRAELTAWAHAKRAMLCSRPWLAELPFVAAPHGPNWLAWLEAVGADLGRAIGDPRFPKFAALISAPPEARPRTLEESFDFGLQRVLDGIELYITSGKQPDAETG